MAHQENLYLKLGLRKILVIYISHFALLPEYIRSYFVNQNQEKCFIWEVP